MSEINNTEIDTENNKIININNVREYKLSTIKTEKTTEKDEKKKKYNHVAYLKRQNKIKNETKLGQNEIEIETKLGQNETKLGQNEIENETKYIDFSKQQTKPFYKKPEFVLGVLAGLTGIALLCYKISSILREKRQENTINDNFELDTKFLEDEYNG